MPIKLIGPNWPSKLKLQSLLDSLVGNLNVSWGATNVQGALNGHRRFDGLEQLQAFTAAGVPAPEATTDMAIAKQWIAEGHLVFGRQRNHTRGKDIVGPRHPRWRRSEFWVKVIPNVKQEWRIHVFNGKSIARGLKVQIEEPWRKMPVRNRANGWHMVHDQKPPELVRETAKAAVKALGYDFAAVDLLLTEDDKVFVLEANTAPGLDDHSAAAYAKAIGKVAQAA
jgi:hypothetical protein